MSDAASAPAPHLHVANTSARRLFWSCVMSLPSGLDSLARCVTRQKCFADILRRKTLETLGGATLCDFQAGKTLFFISYFDQKLNFFSEAGLCCPLICRPSTK